MFSDREEVLWLHASLMVMLLSTVIYTGLCGSTVSVAVGRADQYKHGGKEDLYFICMSCH